MSVLHPERTAGLLLALSTAAISMAVVSAADADRRLADAARNRDHRAVQALVTGGADVNGRQPDGATALHWAAHWDDLATADTLLTAGAAVDVENDLGVTPLALAATNGSIPMLTRLLDAGASPDAPAGTRETPLMLAARTGVVDAVRLLLDRGADANAVEPAARQTALMWAAAEKHTAVVKLLVERGAAIGARSQNGYSPLLFAARSGDLDAARILLAAGAPVNDAVPDGTSVLVLATVRGHAALARHLLERGADANASASGYGALHWVAGSWETEMTGPNGIRASADNEWRALGGVPEGRLDLMRALLAHGADPNLPLVKTPPRVGYTQLQVEHRVAGTAPFPGATPFLLSAMAADVAAMRLLVEYGADPRRTSHDKTTALMVAAGLGRYLAESRVTPSQAFEAVRLAHELGVPIDAVNDAGNTALHGAAFIKLDEVVEYLIEHGAPIEVKNKRGQTPETLGDTTRAGSATIAGRTATGDLIRRLKARTAQPQG
jgi:ankyrin repeat protein